MKQNRFKIFAACTLLLGVASIVSSCRKYAYDENKNNSHCYCVYFKLPGVQQREDVRMRSQSNPDYARYYCSITIQNQLTAKGYKEVSCSID